MSSATTAQDERIRALEQQLAEAQAQFDRQKLLYERTSEKIMRDTEEMVRVLTELEERDALIAKDLQYALRFQRAILPKKLLYTHASFEVIYLPAEIVSGDIYDIFELGDGRLRVFLADATGHGVSAALTTMFIKSQYDSLKVAGGSPSELLSAVNDTMTAYAYADMRFTAVCADFHPRYNRVTYATAAHPRPLVVRITEEDSMYDAFFAPSGGPYLGLEPGLAFPEHSVELARGERIYFVTDGLVDATSPDGSRFGEDRVSSYAKRAMMANVELSMLLTPALSTFVTEGCALADDVTVIGMCPKAESDAPPISTRDVSVL